MSSINVNQPPEEDQNEPKPDADKQSSFEPKRVIHLSKPLSDSSNSKFPETKDASDSIAADQNETPTENAKPEGIPTRGDRTVPQFSDKRINPGLRLRALVTAGKNAPPPKPQSKPRLPSKLERIPLAYWGVAAGLSLIVNAILVVALLSMGAQIKSLKTTVNGLFSGLYANSVEMDKASLTTTITVDTQVPVNFMLPIQQDTDAVLTHSVAIPHAYVVINSGGLSINAQASITLPAGTSLPISLNMAVPVQFSIPITLQLPVNIPLAQTDLHQSFASLQDTVRTYYCTFNKNAQYPQGTYICEDHEIPTATPGVP